MTAAAPSRPALLRVARPLAVGLGAALGCAVVWVADPTTPGGVLPVCPTKALLGITCPGCGSLRATYALMHGDLGAALGWNALGVLALGLVALGWATWLRESWTGRRGWAWQRLRWSPVVVLVATLGWVVVRNIPVAPFTSLRV